jgi:hypothetical protein
MTKRERLIQNGNKLIFMQSKVVNHSALFAYKLLEFRKSTM